MGVYYLGPLKEFENIILRLVEPPVPCGAPGPPESYRERRIQLSDLVDHPYASYLWIASGDSMIGAGIHSGDFLLVDKALLPVQNDVVIAALNGEPIVKRLCIEDKKVLLLPENPEAAFIVEEIRETADGKNPRDITANVIKALETAQEELHRVISALREIKHRPVKKAQGLRNFTVYWTLKGRKVYKARTEEEAGEIHNMDSLACESEVCEDVYIEEGGEV